MRAEPGKPRSSSWSALATDSLKLALECSERRERADADAGAAGRLDETGAAAAGVALSFAADEEGASAPGSGPRLLPRAPGPLAVDRAEFCLLTGALGLVGDPFADAAAADGVVGLLVRDDDTGAA